MCRDSPWLFRLNRCSLHRMDIYPITRMCPADPFHLVLSVHNSNEKDVCSIIILFSAIRSLPMFTYSLAAQLIQTVKSIIIYMMRTVWSIPWNYLLYVVFRPFWLNHHDLSVASLTSNKLWFRVQYWYVLDLPSDTYPAQGMDTPDGCLILHSKACRKWLPISDDIAIKAFGFRNDFNTLRPRRNGQHFADDIFKRIFFNENVWISIKMSLKFVPKGPINNIPALVQIMAWRRSGDKPLPEAMVVRLLTHICVTRHQWVNQSLFLGIQLIRDPNFLWIRPSSCIWYWTVFYSMIGENQCL